MLGEQFTNELYHSRSFHFVKQLSYYYAAQAGFKLLTFLTQPPE